MARLFVDNLTVMDFSYLDVARGVVGESWIVDIELAGELNDQGMVFDFGHVKKQIKQLIDAQADHRLLVPAASHACLTQASDKQVRVVFQLDSGGVIEHCSPRDAVLLIAADSVDSQTVAEDLQVQLRSVLPENVQQVCVKLRPEAIDGAFFHYTHGLQKHQGQCQRIAHGHRSRLEISVDEQRCFQRESAWVERLRDSYIATASHVTDVFDHNGIEHVRLAYTAAQGAFSLSLPSDAVFVMPLVSTVENIAIHLAGQVAEQARGRVTVKAFEGVGKGAFGTADGADRR